MKVSLSKGVLTIEIPVNDPPKPSTSGKTRIVATSSGNKPTSVIIDGKPVTVGVNAYIAN